MRARFLIVPGLAMAGAILWLGLSPSGARTVDVPAAAPAERASAPAKVAPTVKTEDAPSNGDEIAKALDSHKLDTRSDAFVQRKNDDIPERLYAEAAKCYRGQVDRDQKIKIEFRMHIEDGEVSVSNIRILKNTLSDRELERCILDEVRKTRFKDPEMPDWESTEELLMRMRGFKKYAQSSEPGEDDPG
jgi:hypothetical protein